MGSPCCIFESLSLRKKTYDVVVCALLIFAVIFFKLMEVAAVNHEQKMKESSYWL
jgi:cell division protein FtsI/penicillin-binding protein 2